MMQHAAATRMSRYMVVFPSAGCHTRGDDRS
jgi:hypothetical protein